MKTTTSTADTGENLIEFRGVHKTYDNGIKALRDVNISIAKGEFVFIVGASGAGKSTFLKLIMHEQVPNAGEVVVNGYRLSHMKKRRIPYLRRTMGIVFQDFRLINTMTVFDNVAFAMRVIGAPKREVRKRVPYILGLVGLQNKARSYPMELSGGEQQRVSLARALVNNPYIIIADEPTGNIDPELSYEIMELLTEINRRGTTVLVVTHEHELVKEFGRRVIVISEGCVVSDSIPQQAMSSDEPEDTVDLEEMNAAEASPVPVIRDSDAAALPKKPAPSAHVDDVLADILKDHSTGGDQHEAE